MTNGDENLKPDKLKKEIKWYTYVDSRLDSKLLDFMKNLILKTKLKSLEIL